MSANFRRRYITDFGRVEGVPGVYMANQLSLHLLHDSGNFHPVNYEKFIKSKVRHPTSTRTLHLNIHVLLAFIAD